MKILHVETGRHLYGGPQQVIYLCAGLARQGVESVLVCPPGSGVDEAARNAGIRVINVSCVGDLDMRFAWRLRQVLAEERPDLVHCHSRRGGDLLGGRAAAMAGIPAVVSRRVDNTEAGLLASLRYRPFRKIVAISETIAGMLVDAGVDRAKIVVIRSAVDVDRFSDKPDCAPFRRQFRLADSDFVVAAAAQFIPRKGHVYLLRAVSALRSRFPGLRLVLFGQGPLGNELRALSAELELGGVVQFAGFRRDLDDYLGCFDLLVHPALQEGLGVIALKASAAGVPVVAFDAGGLREVVVHGETGLLVPLGNEGALADAIAALIDDGDLRARYAAAARERMRENFSVAEMVAKHMTLYESILNG